MASLAAAGRRLVSLPGACHMLPAAWRADPKSGLHPDTPLAALHCPNTGEEAVLSPQPPQLLHPALDFIASAPE